MQYYGTVNAYADIPDDGESQALRMRLRRVGALCGLLVIFVGALTLFSWVRGVTLFTSVLPAYVPMEPSTATCFVLLGQVLVLCSYVRGSRLGRRIAMAGTLIVLGGSIITLAEFLLQNSTGIEINIEQFFSVISLPGTVSIHMSPLTATNFLLASVALLLLLQRSYPRYHHRIGDLAFTASGLSLIILLGYLYGTPLFYGGRVIPMALTTAVCFLILGAGLTAVVGPDHFPLNIFTGPSARAKFLRVLLPFTVISTLAYGILYKQIVLESIFTNSVLLSAIVFTMLMGMTVSMMAYVVGNRIDRAAQARLRAEEAKLRLAAIVESSSDAIIGVAFDHTVSSWNKGARGIFGYGEDEIVGRLFSRLFDSGMAGEIAALMDSVRDGKHVSLERSCVRKDGKNIDVLLSFAPVLDVSGNTVAMSAIMRDITGEKQSERTLKSNFARLTTLIEHLPIAVLIEDEMHRVLHVSAKFCSLFDLPAPPAGLVGQQSDAIFKRCERILASTGQFERCRAEQLQDGKPFFSRELVLADERVFECDFLPVAVGNTRCGNLWQFREVTARRKEEQAKSNFILLASHQLRTPLAAMRFAWETLSQGKVGLLNDKQKAILDESMKFARRMSVTINTILSISRIDAGHVKPVLSTVALEPLMGVVAAEYESECAAKHQHLRVACHGDLKLLTDASMLTEVMHSLVSNAVNYTPDHGKISIEARQEQGRILLTVTDTGFGIPVKDREFIFQKFFRAENVFRKRPNGTGIGLYLAHSLVEILGGVITFKPQPKEGTVFIINFPATA